MTAEGKVPKARNERRKKDTDEDAIICYLSCTVLTSITSSRMQHLLTYLPMAKNQAYTSIHSIRFLNNNTNSKGHSFVVVSVHS